MEFNRIDFLEWFDTEEVVDQEAGYVRYIVSSDENITLSIFMNIHEDFISCSLDSPRHSLLGFILQGISHIKCYKDKPGIVQFLFYEDGKEHPILKINIHPSIYLDFDFEAK
ncbi:MAG TPA: hypothetical protein VFF04_02210 [Candidatus Babeliales bacterium]|nr:hypothetical protein [Candidatus Babeliales bacterium]